MVDHIPYTCELVMQETFGPVIPIIRVPNDIDSVIRISNATAFGLSSGVCTNRLDYITRFVNELDVGTVNIWEVRAIASRCRRSAASKIPGLATRKVFWRR